MNEHDTPHSLAVNSRIEELDAILDRIRAAVSTGQLDDIDGLEQRAIWCLRRMSRLSNGSTEWAIVDECTAAVERMSFRLDPFSIAHKTRALEEAIDVLHDLATSVGGWSTSTEVGATAVHVRRVAAVATLVM